MLDSFIFSFNSIAPIFILVVLGAILKKTGFVSVDFLSVCDRLVFNVCLPCLLFVDIADANITESINGNLILFCIVGVTLAAFIPCFIVPIFVKDVRKCGAFIQGIFRSNSAILGVTLAENMFGASGTTAMATILPFTIVLYNAYAVIILTMFAPSEHKMSARKLVLHIVKGVFTNPMIVAIALALLWQLVPTQLPKTVDKSLSYLSDMSMPLALISLGGSINTESLRGRLGLAFTSSILKTVIVPAAAVSAAVLLGFRNVELIVVFILFSTPAAVSSYIMTKQMKSDHELAAQILLVSTLMSLFTMFVGIFILRNFGLI